MTIITNIYNAITNSKKAKAKKLAQKANKAIEIAKVEQAKAKKEVDKLEKKVAKLQSKIDKIKAQEKKLTDSANVYVKAAEELKKETNIAKIKAEYSESNLKAYKEATGLGEKAIALILLLADTVTGSEKKYIESKTKKAEQKTENKAEQKAENKAEAKQETKKESKQESKQEPKQENKPVEGTENGKIGFFYTNKKGEKNFYPAQYTKKQNAYGVYIGSTFYKVTKVNSKGAA